MEQASGSFMTGIRAFSAHLPPISLLLLRPSTAISSSTIAFQVNTGVSYLLDYVMSKISTMMVVLSAPVSILNPNLMYLSLPQPVGVPHHN